MHKDSAGKAPFYYITTGSGATPPIVWAHGWGQSHESFMHLAASLGAMGRHLLVDFPGFGRSPPPPETWGTADYADAAAAFIRSQTGGKVVWVGHSFGCRVGLQLAARQPDLVAGLFLIAAAGLKPNRPLPRKIYVKLRIALYKLLKTLVPAGPAREWLMRRFAARDYANADPALRKILVRVVNEDLAEEAARITCPVMLVYGTKDSETPPEMGERLQALIAGSELVLLEGQDHYSVLGEGRHQVAVLLKRFLHKIDTRHAD